MERQPPPRPSPVHSSTDATGQAREDTNGHASTSTGIDDWREFRQLCDQSFVNIDTALHLDESGRDEEASDLYRRTLPILNQALSCALSLSNSHYNEFCGMQQKLAKSKVQVESRIETLTQSFPLNSPVLNTSSVAVVDDSLPPSYEHATSLTSLGDDIMNNDIVESSSVIPANAEELFCIEEGVQIYFITYEGYVSAPSYPSALKIYRFIDDVGQGNASEFLQIGQWYYPLVPGLSPVLHSDNGSYIFPDTTAPDSGCSVGLILADSISRSQRDAFEKILRTVTAMQSDSEATARPDELVASDEATATPTAEPGEATPVQSDSEERISLKISRGIITAAGYISRGVTYGAEKAGEYIKKGSSKIQANLKAEESEREIPEKYQNGLEKVRRASHVAVTVSGYVVKFISEATVQLGKQLAPHLTKASEKILPKSMVKKSPSGHSKLDSVVEVAGSSLAGFGQVYMSLETAAKALARSLADETVDVVSYKYGAQAGKLADNSIYSAGNVLMTGHNAQHLGVKAIARRVAKGTGKAVIKDMAKEKPARPSLPPGSDKSSGNEKGDRVH